MKHKLVKEILIMRNRQHVVSTWLTLLIGFYSVYILLKLHISAVNMTLN